MTAAVPSMPSAPSPAAVLEQVKAAQRRNKRSFRIWFILTWIALVGALLSVLWLTGNINVDFIASAGPFIVQGAGTESDIQSLRARLGDRVPRYMLPRVVRFVDRFPMTANGKIDRRKLAESL